MSVVDDKNNIYLCLICNESYEEIEVFKNHLSIHSYSSNFSPTYEDSYTRVNLSDNFYEIELPDKCINEDELAFTVQQSYIKSTKFKEVHVCSICGKEFRRKDHLNKHYMVHSGKRPFLCMVCNKSFARKDRLKDHCVMHLANGWSCYFCGRMFPQRCILRKHEMIHRGIKPFTCELCDKKFSRKNDLLRHGTSHTGKKTHFCEVCQKGFTQKRLLKRHSRIHLRMEKKKHTASSSNTPVIGILSEQYFS